jgi:hypothetical protein
LKTTTSRPKPFLLLTPLVGTIVFILLYLIATLLYPGGSQHDRNAEGFSWTHNYWCNLLNEKAINGKSNPARPVALLAMFVLGTSLVIFWMLFAGFAGFGNRAKTAISLSAVSAMVFGMFIFTSHHDIFVNAAVLCTLVALAATFIGLYRKKWYKLFYSGLLNIILIVINNILYYTPGLIRYLPVVQKITFLFFLVWICLIDLRMLASRKKQQELVA